MNSSNPKILLIRMDRIGDLVLTLSLENVLNSYSTHWFIQRGLGFVPDHSEQLIEYTEFDKEKPEVQRMVQAVKKIKPDLAITFHAPWWVNWALLLAGVPRRCGVMSQWHSFAFLNEGLRQKRSRAHKHESHYNLELLEFALGKHIPLKKLKPLHLIATPREGNYVVVHPGMGGSALNWSPKRYYECLEVLANKIKVVITGTRNDRKWLEPLYEKLNSHPNIEWLHEKLSTTELLQVLAGAQCVVAPSTGVIHLAASLGVPVVGIYSPKKVEHPRRWGPLGKDISIHVPREETHEGLEGISVQEVVKSVEEYLKQQVKK